MSEINYDKTLNTTAGYLEIRPETTGPSGTSSDAEPLKPPNEQTLLHLLFWALYTRPGRDFMRTNKPANGALTDSQKTALTNKFAQFGVTDPARVGAILDAHVAAENWTLANAQGPAGFPNRDLNEKQYLQKMAFITWCLWEDAKGHEFSMGW